MISPTTPATSFCGRGALTIGSKIGGSGISALEPAGDFERHQRSGPGQIPAGDHEVDVLELAGGAEVRHEVGHRGRRERRAGDLDLEALLLEPGDPEIVRKNARERVGENDRPSLSLGQPVDDFDPPAQLARQVLHPGLLADLRLQQREVLLRLIDVGRERRLRAVQRPPVTADREQRDQVHDAEEPAEVEGRKAELEARNAPPATFGREVDLDHFCLSPGRRSARPTATASAGPAAWTSSAYAGSTSTRWKGLVSSTGM